MRHQYIFEPSNIFSVIGKFFKENDATNCRSFIHIFLFVFFFYLSLESCVGAVVYVSSSLGDDMNDGLTIEKPVRTIVKALSISDSILLKRGDVFYERIALKGKYLGAYDEGDKPQISGFKRLVKPNWKNLKQNIWGLDLTQNNFTGFDTKGTSRFNNIGAIYEYDKDLVHGTRVQYITELDEDWEFFQTDKSDQALISANDFDILYLYSTADPNTLKLEFAVSSMAMSVTNSIVENMTFRGFGDGLYIWGNSTVRNCEIDVIGGSQWLNPGSFVCLGNGINFWISDRVNNNSLVENNVISRCYDCGATIQGRPISDKLNPCNIIIQNNLIYDCCQGFESFLRNEKNNAPMKYIDCYFRSNTVANIGRTSGFGYDKNRVKYCHVLSNDFTGSNGMIIENNTFIGGNYFCSSSFKEEYKANVWKDNTCVIKRGDFILKNLVSTKDELRIPTEKGQFNSLSAATEDAINRYRELTGDQTTKFVIKEETKINRQINKIKKKHLTTQ